MFDGIELLYKNDDFIVYVDKTKDGKPEIVIGRYWHDQTQGFSPEEAEKLANIILEAAYKAKNVE